MHPVANYVFTALYNMESDLRLGNNGEVIIEKNNQFFRMRIQQSVYKIFNSIGMLMYESGFFLYFAEEEKIVHVWM